MLNVKVQFYADDIVRVVKWLPGGTLRKIEPGRDSNEPAGFEHPF